MQWGRLLRVLIGANWEIWLTPCPCVCVSELIYNYRGLSWKVTYSCFSGRGLHPGMKWWQPTVIGLLLDNPEKWLTVWCYFARHSNIRLKKELGHMSHSIAVQLLPGGYACSLILHMDFLLRLVPTVWQRASLTYCRALMCLHEILNYF